jgi:hypothetical protein
MTVDNGQFVTGERSGRSDEVAGYVAAVREALADLPAAVRDELVEDLRAHLAEVMDEEDRPLRDLLGPPAEYAAELRAAVAPGAPPGRRFARGRLAADLALLRGWLNRVDHRAGPLLGYRTASEFGRLLMPAWWVLRGYVAAMIVVIVLGGSVGYGLLPRLGGSTIAGLIILAVFVVGSVWLARREPGMRRWPRRAVQVISAMILLFAIVQFFELDGYRTLGGQEPSATAGIYDPLADVADVYVIDRNGTLLTDVRLVDQNGLPIDIGWVWCDTREELDWTREWIPEVPAEGPEGLRQSPQLHYTPVQTYPRCPESLPWWLEAIAEPLPDRTPAPTPAATPQPTPGSTPQPEAPPAPSPTG